MYRSFLYYYIIIYSCDVGAGLYIYIIIIISHISILSCHALNALNGSVPFELRFADLPRAAPGNGWSGPKPEKAEPKPRLPGRAEP